MKSLRLLMIIAIALTLVFAVSYSFAEEKKEAEKAATSEKAEAPKAEKAVEKKAKKPKVPTVKGEVVSVDENSIVIKGAKGEETKLELNKDTTAKKGKKDITLQDIKAGEKVKVEYSEAEGKMTAKLIKVSAEKGKEKAKAKDDAAKEEAPKAEPAKAEPEKE